MSNFTEEGVSKLEAVKHSYTWNIKDFHNWPKTTEEKLVSPVLSIELLDGSINICMKLFHEVIEDEDNFIYTSEIDAEYPAIKDDLSLSITFSNSKKSLINIHVKISVYNNWASIYAHHEQWKRSYSGSGEVHWFNCLKHSSILNPQNDLLLEDTLILHFEFTIPTKVDNALLKKNKLRISGDKEPKLLSDLSNLFENQIYSDLIVTASCGKQFQVHRNILAARSKVFAAMLQNEMLEKNQNIVNITDIDGKTVEEMLSFIYTGKIDFSSSDPNTMVQVADRYAIEDLKQACEISISETITIENVVEVFIVANLHNADQLKTVCLNFIGQNMDKVMKTQGFKNVIMNRDPNLSEIFYELEKLNIQ